jgi:hypothetical protein
MWYFAKATGFGWNKATVIHVISYVGITAILGVLIWIARRIFDLGKIVQRLDTVEKDVKSVKTEVKKTGKDLAERIDNLMLTIAQSGLTESHSPRQLTSEGERILKSSGINDVVDSKFNVIVSKVRSLNPENAYRAEKATIDVVRELGKDPTIKDAVEEGAFNSGSLVDVVLFVGAIYIRDRVLKELGFNSEEIDKHQDS